GAKDFWLSKAPSNLLNHQFIKVRVASSNEFASKTSGISVQTGFVEVIGLSEIINIDDVLLKVELFVMETAKNSEGELKVLKEARQGLRYVYHVVSKNKDGTKDVSILLTSPPEHLSNGDVVKISVEPVDKNIELFGSKEIEFEVKGLEEVIIKSSTSRIFIVIGGILGIVLTLGSAGLYFFLKRRKINKLG
ncbi:MAG: hypothetical protein KAG14_04055, partial [Mycoplasmataceae bacterium]|nr:hypothetical protein [Mycoplasmataceae bacterium]